MKDLLFALLILVIIVATAGGIWQMKLNKDDKVADSRKNEVDTGYLTLKEGQTTTIKHGYDTCRYIKVQGGWVFVTYGDGTCFIPDTRLSIGELE